ncbi:AlpA family transcriptional regulator [Pseudomonas sp. LABIM340]|uniref:AlpA family transcriptional regulator n=1 Tax=Pseudomonas sp. LABIM340 TaxID=3156585 RepID=UPI0032B0238A
MIKGTETHMPAERRIMRLPEVIRLCGLKRSSIYLLMTKREFPKAKRIGTRAVGWDSMEIEQWIVARLEGQAWIQEEHE